MGRPANQYVAGREARQLLVRTLPGSRRGTVKAHLRRAESIAQLIWRRWNVGPRQWQAKHLRWYLTTHALNQQPSTAYRDWLTIRALAHALGQADNWLHHLQGSWIRPTGQSGALQTGRPPKLPATAQHTRSNVSAIMSR